MKTMQAVQYFGSMAGLLTVMAGSGVGGARGVRKWGQYPPEARQYQLEVLTNGGLRAQRGGRRGEDYRE